MAKCGQISNSIRAVLSQQLQRSAGKFVEHCAMKTYGEVDVWFQQRLVVSGQLYGPAGANWTEGWLYSRTGEEKNVAPTDPSVCPGSWMFD
jgi:hypothetical protein